MMQRILYAALFLLIVQAGLIVTLNKDNSNLNLKTPDALFWEFSPETISGIEISDSHQQKLTLQKKDGDWKITSAFSAPADSTLVKDLLAKLANAKQGFAIATSSGAAGRFKTAKDDYERHILIKKGDQSVADFFLGTSAGMRNSHIRKAGEDGVFSLEISSYEVEANADKWLDKSRFQLKKDKLKLVKIADLELKKEESGWQVASGPQEVKKEKIEELLNAIVGLTVESVLDPEKVKPLFDKEVDLQFTVSTEEKKNVQYFFAQQENQKVLKISDTNFYFKVPEWQVSKLQEFNREKLIQSDNGKEQIDTSLKQ